MSRSKRPSVIVLIGFSIALVSHVFIPVAPAQANLKYEVIDERFSFDTGGMVDEKDYHGLYLNSSDWTFFDQPSWLACQENRNGFESATLVTKTVADDCKGKNFLRFHVNLPVCELKISTNCISALYAHSASGEQDAVFQSYTSGEGIKFINSNIPGNLTGATPSVWKFANDPSDYLVVARLDGEFDLNKKEISNLTTNIQIQPVSKVAAMGLREPFAKSVKYYADYSRTWEPKEYGFHPIPSCAVITLDTCYMKEKFSRDQNISLQFELNMPLNGWFHGRLSDGSIKVQKNGETFSYHVGGSPTRVPLILGYSTIANSPTQKTLGVTVPIPGSLSAMQELEAWLPLLGDKSQAAPLWWQVTSLSGYNSKCWEGFNDVIGIVSTNAAAYTPGAPYWNAIDQTLDYKLVSPHFDPDGTISKGDYSLQINKNVARCMYGFSQAPIRASLEVTYDGVSQNIGTSTLSEDETWIRLRASNFHYSSPLIRAKFTQEVLQVKENNPIKSSGSKLKTWLCVKNKKSIPKTGKKPSCPAGYKLKLK